MIGQQITGRNALLLALAMLGTLAISLAGADDFGGQSSSGGPPPAEPPPPPCDDDPCCDGNEGGGGGENEEGGAGDGDSEPPSRTDNPISFWNGSESISATDLLVRGVFPIHVSRRYDNQSEYDSPLGFGWAFMHDRRLYEYPDGSVLVRYGCGARDRYTFSGGGYVAPNGQTLATLTQQADGTFVVKYLNGFTDFFDSLGRLTAHQDRQGNRHEYIYDSRGKLPLVGTSMQAIDASQPMVVAYVYRLTRINERGTDGVLTDRFVAFEYDETTGRLLSATTDDGRTVAYQHDVSGGLTQGNLVQVNALGGITATYAYGDPLDRHNMTSITAAQGRTPVINVYDDQDRVIRQDEGTRQIQFSYAVPLTRTTVTRTVKDQNGLNPYTPVTTYDFDETGRITKVTDPQGNESRYTYSAAKRLTRKEVWQKVGSTLSLLRAIAWTYDAAGHRLTKSVALDTGETVTTTWTYDHDRIASEQIVSTAAPAKVFRTEYTFFYAGDGRPKNLQSIKRRKDDGSFQVTAYSYDSRDRLLTTTLPDGVQIVNEYTGEYLTHSYFANGGTAIAQLDRRYEYDAEGRRHKRWDGRNQLTQYDYDERGRLTSATNALGEQTLYTYDQNKLTHVEVGRTSLDGEGQVTRLLYDSRDRLIAVQRKNDAGAYIDYSTFQLDSEGRRLAVSDANNRTTLLAYDLLGRLKTITDPAGKITQLGYDAAGNRTSVTDAAGRTVAYEYDDLRRITAVVQAGVTPSPRIEYSYDAAGNMVAVKDPEGHSTAYQFDTLSRKTSVTLPLGQVVQYGYDERNQLQTLINARNQKIEFSYDPWGAISTEQHCSSAAATTPVRTINYGYDNESNPVSISDDEVQATPIYTVSYDPLGRRYDETIRYIPGGDRILRHRYDRYGNRRQLTLEDGASVVNTYVYDKLNQVASAMLAGGAIALNHFATSERQSISLPNGVSEQFTYRPNGPVETITISGPAGQVAQFEYTYDDVLNVATETDQYGTHQFAYDGLNRLTTETRPPASGLASTSYGYDRVGNREDPGSAALYDYDNNNRITAAPGLTYTFDADGNLQTRSDGASLTHDALNRLQQFSLGPMTATYLYDPGGRRIRKTVAGTNTWFVWDGGRILTEYDAAGTRKVRYGYLPKDYLPTQLEDANGTYYVHPDHLQAPRLATGAAAQVVWRARHDAFGAFLLEADPDGNGTPIVYNQRLPGQYADAETGLYYNRVRFYDPVAGRFAQSDPFGLLGGINLFAYAMNSPTNAIDPDGTQARPPGPRNPRVPRGGNGNYRDAYEWMAQRYRDERELPPWLREPPPPRMVPPIDPPGYAREQRENMENFLEEVLKKQQEQLKPPDPTDDPGDDKPPPDVPPPGVCTPHDEEDRKERERRREEWLNDRRKMWIPND